MKWIRWSGAGFDTKESADEDPINRRTWPEDVVVCEKYTSWREIESGVLNTDDGKLHITLKPVPKVLSVRDAANDLILRTHEARKSGCSIPPYIDDAIHVVEESFKRESSRPANPYTREAVEELLDAAEKSGMRWTNPDEWHMNNRPVIEAIVTLKKQREAANGA